MSNAEEDRFCGRIDGAEVVGESEHRPSITDSTGFGILSIEEDTIGHKLSSKGRISASLICESSSLVIE
jgi:hypothetical protein